MEGPFVEAKKNPLITDVAEELEEVWKSCGCPAEGSGMSTGVRGTIPPWLEEDDDCFEGVPENEIKFLVQEYNNALEMLLELTGIWNVGGNTWNTYYFKAEDRKEYEEKAWEIALDFLHLTMWNRFCSMV